MSLQHDGWRPEEAYIRKYRWKLLQEMEMEREKDEAVAARAKSRLREWMAQGEALAALRVEQNRKRRSTQLRFLLLYFLKIH